MTEPSESPFSLSPICMAAKIATPLAERRARRGAWATVAVLIAAAVPTAMMGGWPAFALYAPAALAAGWWLTRRQMARSRRRRDLWSQPFPGTAEAFLTAEVMHFRRLDEAGRELFRQRAKIFLAETAFHGAGVEVDEGLTLLAAAASVVPTLGFPEWQWPGLKEIIFRPEGYADGSLVDDGGVVTEFEESGMVGDYGVLSGVMMLSSEDLIQEFAHPEEGANVGFHEFAHLLLGNGEGLAANDQAGWERLTKKEWQRISRRDSLLDEYALVNPAELLAVASELFFTIPHLFKNWHRELYAVLSRAYRQDPCRWLDDCAPAPEELRPRRRKRGKRRIAKT